MLVVDLARQVAMVYGLRRYLTEGNECRSSLEISHPETHSAITYSSHPSLSHLLVFSADFRGSARNAFFSQPSLAVPVCDGFTPSSCCFLAVQIDRRALAAIKSTSVQTRAVRNLEEGSTTVLKMERYRGDYQRPILGFIPRLKHSAYVMKG